ncbi:MAG: M15 family metallopeptidase [Erysipelotrichaceae bacterium]|nr:M15 family metallopeptidase [Erysipelotrichaceae bacterium]
MKKILLVLLSCFLLFGCSQVEEQEEIDTQPPTLELTKQRIHVDIDATIDYTSYILSASDNEDGDNMIDEVTYNEIDTSEISNQIITYTLSDNAGNTTTQQLIVDVVEYLNDTYFNPETCVGEEVVDPTDITVLVNKLHYINEDWEPDDLVSVCDNQYIYLRKEAAEAYEAFYNAAVSQGIELYSISGFRTYETQETYWNNQKNVYDITYASQYSAYPGRSEHELGLAMDVSYKTTGNRLSESVADSDIGKFIASDAYKYGFILRYPQDKTDITNYNYEPWHMRYVGVELATYLYENNLTLEEYYGE